MRFVTDAIYRANIMFTIGNRLRDIYSPVYDAK